MLRGECMKYAKTLRNECGAAVIEFALVVPLLLVLVFGIIEFAILMYDKAMITNASREGARAGITVRAPRMSTTEIVNKVNDYCQDYLITFDPADPPPTIRTLVNKTVGDPSVTGMESGVDFLTVEVSYVYDYLLLPGFIKDMAGTITLVASTTMRAE